MEKILYIGGFEMPDGNAAAQRVLAIAKTIRDDYEIKFYGTTHTNDYKGTVCGFEYENLPYPSSSSDWYKHLNGEKELQKIKEEKPDFVIAYNFPALGLYRIIKFCKKNDIKVVGDITEWYHPHNFVKSIDVAWRMRVLNKKMDGLIVISRYLEEYYKGIETFLMPPTIDIAEKKWHHGLKEPNNSKKIITLMYAGSPGRGDKDRLDNLIRAIGKYDNLKLTVVGIGRELFEQKFSDVPIPENVAFRGRLPHEETIRLLCESDFSIFFRKSTRVNNAGFPTKYVEAQAAGIPVIASKFSDLEHYVESGKNGFLAEDVSFSSIDTVLRHVSGLKREQIIEMHKYTKSLNQFDYHLFKDRLRNFIKTL
jgi:glycosyltransferase involved in cell wall biosynthesis